MQKCFTEVSTEILRLDLERVEDAKISFLRVFDIVIGIKRQHRVQYKMQNQMRKKQLEQFAAVLEGKGWILEDIIGIVAL